MKLQIGIALYNDEGSCATIENGDDDSITFAVAHSDNDPAECCARAAEQLRAAADRFDKLATMKNPFKEATQKKVNR